MLPAIIASSELNEAIARCFDASLYASTPDFKVFETTGVYVVVKYDDFDERSWKRGSLPIRDLLLKRCVRHMKVYGHPLALRYETGISAT